MKALRLVQPRLLQGLLEAPEAPGWECFKALMQELRYVEICWNLLKSYMLKYVEIISCKLKVLSATCSEARRDFYTWWRNWNIQPFTWLWQHEVAPSLDGLPWRVSCRPQGQIWCRGHVKLVELNSFRAKLREKMRCHAALSCLRSLSLRSPPYLEAVFWVPGASEMGTGEMATKKVPLGSKDTCWDGLWHAESWWNLMNIMFAYLDFDTYTTQYYIYPLRI